MFTFKEALCLLAIVVAYGITGRMDYDDALLLEQPRQRVGIGCTAPLSAGGMPPEVGPPDPQEVPRPFEGPREDEACAPSSLLTQR